jgi:hypothetical protein
MVIPLNHRREAGDPWRCQSTGGAPAAGEALLAGLAFELLDSVGVAIADEGMESGIGVAAIVALPPSTEKEREENGITRNRTGRGAWRRRLAGSPSTPGRWKDHPLAGAVSRV